MNIIFLDVDGVLNSLPYCNKYPEEEISEYHVKMLAQLYNKVNAKIVLSSTWRDCDHPDEPEVYKMYKYLLDMLNKYSMEIIDKIPVVNGDRPLEIKTWATEHNCSTYISLDDDFNYEDYKAYGIENHLIQTKFFCNTIQEGGIQQRHVDEAIKKFEIMNKM